MPIVTENGFADDSWRRMSAAAIEAGDALQPGVIAPFAALADAGPGDAPEGLGVEISPTVQAEELEPYFAKLSLIAVPFAAFADGRGFSLARRLRDSGFSGVLRATGNVIPDQFAFARAAGFDEVEISDERAARQPEADWLHDISRPGWYQRNLLNGAVAR